MKKYYYAKEITCRACEGMGIIPNRDFDESYFPIVDEDDCSYYLNSDKDVVEIDHTCPQCKGSGYIIDTYTNDGFTIYSDSDLEFYENPYMVETETIVDTEGLKELVAHLYIEGNSFEAIKCEIKGYEQYKEEVVDLVVDTFELAIKNYDK